MKRRLESSLYILKMHTNDLFIYLLKKKTS